MTPEEKEKLEMNYKGTTLDSQRMADVLGVSAQLWRISLPAEDKPTHACVGMWLLHAPHAHPWWEYYVVDLIHLRPLEGVAPPRKNSPRAMYEVIVRSLDPRQKVPDMAAISKGDTPELYPLEPSDFVAQFDDVGGDHVAYDIVDEMCIAVTQGQLSPDSDYRVLWSTKLTQLVLARTLGGRRTEVH